MLIDVQKQNFKKLLAIHSLQYLRPQPQVYQIIIPQSDIFFPYSSIKDKRRRIYYKVKYEAQEYEAIEQVKKQLQKRQLNQKLSNELILKHIYASKFDIQKAVDRLKLVIQYHHNPLITTFDENTIRKLQTGSFYTYGCDKQMRPIIIIRIDRINLDIPIMEHFNTVYFLMLTILGYKMVPYHAEKYVLLMDFNDISFTDIPIMYLYDALDKINTYYCGNSQKTYIYNSKGISYLWMLISNFISQNQKKRIIFINKGQQHKFLQYIDQYQLQKKYGGKLPNLTSYWPPKCTNQEFDLAINNVDEQILYSCQNNQSFFEEDSSSNRFCGSPKCQCNIF